MAEQFDMDLYNAILAGGGSNYTAPQNSAPQNSTPHIVMTGDSAANPNLVCLTESYDPINVNYRNFSNGENK